MKCIKFDSEEERIKDFINLPNDLYNKKNITEDKTDMYKLLTGIHSLSKYFKLDKFLIYDEEKAVGRFCITTYPKDKTAYLGFFECINDEKVAKYLFDSAYKFCKKNKYKNIIGPVDASFWIKYRLKINKFDSLPYTGEPYNLDYYFDLFKNNNFNVIEHYTSNIYQQVKEDFNNIKYSDRYNEFIKKGYEIISPDMNKYDEIIESIYYLLMDLYQDFPIFKNVELNDFLEVFKSYKSIINPSMVKLAYYENKLVGFFISVPNYNNNVYNLNLFKILKVLKTRKKPKEYIMLYMGVDQNHKGLGKAIAEAIMNELKVSGLPSVGALTKDGKLTQNYVSELIEERYEYVLLERIIK